MSADVLVLAEAAAFTAPTNITTPIPTAPPVEEHSS